MPDPRTSAGLSSNASATNTALMEVLNNQIKRQTEDSKKVSQGLNKTSEYLGAFTRSLAIDLLGQLPGIGRAFQQIAFARLSGIQQLAGGKSTVPSGGAGRAGAAEGAAAMGGAEAGAAAAGGVAVVIMAAIKGIVILKDALVGLTKTVISLSAASLAGGHQAIDNSFNLAIIKLGSIFASVTPVVMAFALTVGDLIERVFGGLTDDVNDKVANVVIPILIFLIKTFLSLGSVLLKSVEWLNLVAAGFTMAGGKMLEIIGKVMKAITMGKVGQGFIDIGKGVQDSAMQKGVDNDVALKRLRGGLEAAIPAVGDLFKKNMNKALGELRWQTSNAAGGPKFSDLASVWKNVQLASAKSPFEIETLTNQIKALRAAERTNAILQGQPEKVAAAAAATGVR